MKSPIDLFRHSLVIQTVYAELQQVCLDAQSVEGGDLARFGAVGTITPTRKTLKGRTYWYAQYLDASGQRRQTYLGPDSNSETGRLVARLSSIRETGSLEKRRKMVKTLRSAGFTTLDATMDGALNFLVRAGLFRAGAVLVGTPAYHALLTQQGFSERVPTQTHDLDIHVDRARLALAFPQPLDIQNLARDWDSRTFAVPALDYKSSEASIKVRGKEFHIDFLTPGEVSREGVVISIPGLQFGAQALPFLDYLVEDAQPSLVLTRQGAILPLPQPGRFVWHKCAVAAGRPNAWAAKRDKDLHQAATLFSVLMESDPDELNEAASAIRSAQEPEALLSRVQKAIQRDELGAMREWLERALAENRQAPGL